MSETTQDIQDNILAALLPSIAFDGWTWAATREASVQAGYEPSMADAVFPGKLTDVVSHFADWADRCMLAELEDVNIESLRVRDRIRDAVLTRLQILTPYREDVKMALSYYAIPHRAPRASKAVWRTADRIWTWAGDTATDYNRYTKRGLLSAVITSTTLAWLNDDTPDLEKTQQFLDRRIENVMQFGRLVGKVKKAS